MVRIAAGLAAAVSIIHLPHSTAASALTGGDLRWLARSTFGIDAASVSRYRALGREKFLDEQLHPPPTAPSEDSPAVAIVGSLQQSAQVRMTRVRAEQQRINGLATDDEKQIARTALNQAGNDVVYQTSRRHLIRALTAPSQLREQLTWFWMNHFSIFSGKANVRWTMADYEDAVRMHALGKFSDLVRITLTSPAMLEYLDNAQSAVGHVNENYARELMELHTLGVSGGPSGSAYTQTDLQELARVLTGVGLNLTENTPHLSAGQERLYVREGLFEFNPARHDPGPKTVLGHAIAGQGLGEVEDAIRLLCRQPATARYISSKLATYFVADTPPPALVSRMARVFEETDGSIASVVRTMFLDREFAAALNTDDERAHKLKDPMQFVVSSLRLAYEGHTLTNYHPIVNWLQQLGEPLYGRVTPDGYALTAAAWSSPGQMVRRFEIARAIGGGNAGLFNYDDNSPATTTGFPRVASRLYFDAIDPALAERTRQALDGAASQQEWNMLLLASPDWMQR